MTPNARPAQDGRSRDTRAGAGMFADPDSRLRSACQRHCPRDRQHPAAPGRSAGGRASAGERVC